jgi:hypothetical protein
MLGYKVMHRVGRRLVSLADPRHTDAAVVGTTLRMPGAGVFVSTNRNFVLGYYSDPQAAAEMPGRDEVLVTVAFEPSDILRGDPHDRESVLTVRKARIVAIESTHVRHRNPRARREKQPWQMTFAEWVPWYRAQQTWFEDLPIARQYDLVAQHRREVEALERLRFPFEAEWEGRRPILVTGTAPPPAAPGQMSFTYLDTGEKAGTPPYSAGITIGGEPLVHPLPRRDPSKETGFFSGGLNLGEAMRWRREIAAALERGERVPRRVLAEYRRLPLG